MEAEEEKGFSAAVLVSMTCRPSSLVISFLNGHFLNNPHKPNNISFITGTQPILVNE